MCGIVGCAGSIYKPELDTFENLLLFSQVRGPHSTGVGSVSRGKDADPVLAKDVGRPDALIDWNKKYDRVVSHGKKFILGHNRWATTGKINKRNAHPFLFENILGCHNGTIPDHSLKDLKIKPDDFGTDSETVLANMNEHPLKEVFSKLDGTWAFVWYDNRDNSVNFLRNSARELYYTYSLDRQTLFWASETGFLEAALTRNNIKYKEFHKVPEDKHVRWTIPQDANKAFSAPSAVEVKGRQYSNWGNRFRGGSNKNEADEGDYTFTPGNPNNPNSGGAALDGADGGSRVPVSNGVNIQRLTHNTSLPNGSHQFISASDVARETGKLRLVKTTQGDVKDFAKPDDLQGMEGQGYMKGHKDKDVYRGFRGEKLSRQEFEFCTKKNCNWCDASAVWGRPVRFIKRDEHICLECNSDPQIVEMYGTGGK